nr:PREDICTED: protein phosphatase 1 regulatory subunit 12A-like isoform X2 [Latimeria chalumnae]|eukprot:XP_014349751.1 PREDICTED: protein phosphatase 1 regulatory subunit 12A-like isoform X2 [Latimeria chalumnae]
MAAEDRSRSDAARQKRREQLNRWLGSETDQAGTALWVGGRPGGSGRSRVRFAQGAVFMAACSAGDQEEVRELLAKSADINYTNVDGLTALHQACIDENLDMVEFLVEHGANINQPDNEGWTPLHAAASCGFVEISSYLIKHGASVAAVNSEGELPLDVAQESAMERLLQAEIKKQGIDIEAARREEEQVMLRDARQWLNQGKGGDYARHPKTGATPLHVAAAKGYLEVMKLLLQAGLDVNTSDVDGWMPLHAAAHWGQEEACRLLVESLCNMEAVNKVGQTPFDVADDNLESVLEELKKKQNDLRLEKEKQAKSQSALIETSPAGQHPSGRTRRSSISRMSSKEKISLHDKERKTLETLTLEPVALERVNDEEEEGKKDESSSSSSEEEEPSESESDSEKAKTREIINNLNNKLNSPAVSSGSVTTTPASPTKKFGGSMSKPATKEEEKKDQAPASWRTSLRKTGSYAALSSGNAPQEDLKGKDSGIVRSASSPRLSSTETEDKDNDGKETRLARVPPTPTRRLFSNQDNSQEVANRDFVSELARSGSYTRQRASGDSSYVPSSLNRSSSYTRRVSDADSGKKDLGDAVSSDASGLGYQRSSSFGRRALDSVPTSTSGTIAAGTGTSSFPSQQTAATTTSGSYTGRYLSRGQPEESLKEKESSSTVTSLRTTSTTNTETKERRRSYLTPVRDEEAEAQRKARSRHARQSRRSTQGVTLTDLQEAEKTIKSQQEGKQVESKEQEKKKEEEKEKTDENKDILSKYRSSKTNEDGSEVSWRSRIVNLQKSDLLGLTSPSEPARPSAPGGASSYSRYLHTQLDNKELEKSKEEEKDSDDKGNRNKLGIRDRRRPRGKRRSTGVPCLTRDSDENEEGSEEEDEIAEGSEADRLTSRGDSMSNDRILNRGVAYCSHSTASSSSMQPETEGGKKDYKKLYEQLTRENGRLREQLQETQKLIGQTKGELEKASQRQERFVDRSALLETEKKEQRLLERRISELEEELKVLADLKADNQRLKDENGALIRVISKLSK